MTELYLRVIGFLREPFLEVTYSTEKAEFIIKDFGVIGVGHFVTNLCELSFASSMTIHQPTVRNLNAKK